MWSSILTVPDDTESVAKGTACLWSLWTVVTVEGEILREGRKGHTGRAHAFRLREGSECLVIHGFSCNIFLSYQNLSAYLAYIFFLIQQIRHTNLPNKRSSHTIWQQKTVCYLLPVSSREAVKERRHKILFMSVHSCRIESHLLSQYVLNAHFLDNFSRKCAILTLFIRTDLTN
jgi:hypothetical protein